MRFDVASAKGRVASLWESLWSSGASRRGGGSFGAPGFREIVIDGVTARYLCLGSGPPILVIASPLVGARRYLPMMQALAPSFTVVCVELPGSGGSGKLEEAWTVAQYAEWTIELCRRMPLAAPLLIGHAASARVALEVSRLVPSEVAGAILVEREGLGELTASAAPDVVRNALRHRGTFAENMRAACSPPYSMRGAALAAPGRPVAPVFRIGADDDVVAQDARAFGRAVLRFFAGVRRSARAAATAPAMGTMR